MKDGLTTRAYLAHFDAAQRARLQRLGKKAYAAAHEESGRRVCVCSLCDATILWRGWWHLLCDGWAWEWTHGKARFICGDAHITRATPRSAV